MVIGKIGLTSQPQAGRIHYANNSLLKDVHMNSYTKLSASNRILFSELVIGQPIRFGYNGKDRIGVLEKVFDHALCIRTPEGGYKSFTIAKMQPLLNP
jgi:hypothetical protein